MPLSLAISYWNEGIAAIRSPSQAAVARSRSGVNYLELFFVLLVLIICAEIAGKFAQLNGLNVSYREILGVRRGYADHTDITPLKLSLLAATWIMIVIYMGPILAQWIAPKFGGIASAERARAWLFLCFATLIPFHALHVVLGFVSNLLETVFDIERWIWAVAFGVALKLLIMYKQAHLAVSLFEMASLRQGIIIVFCWEILTSLILLVRGAAIIGASGA